jgi:hypothetical protein
MDIKTKLLQLRERVRPLAPSPSLHFAHLPLLSAQAPSLSFDTPQAKDLAVLAFTHSSKSALNNNNELAKLGAEVCRFLPFETGDEEEGSGGRY